MSQLVMSRKILSGEVVRTFRAHPVMNRRDGNDFLQTLKLPGNQGTMCYTAQN